MPKELRLKFTHEMKDGERRVTAGRKHRYAEVPGSPVGQVVGVLYLSEAATKFLGDVDEIVVTISKGEKS